MRGIRGWLDGFRRRRERRANKKVIGLYLTKLPSLLAKDYGARGPYTPAQVERTMERHGLGAGLHAAYAFAIFCDEDDLATLERASGGPDYDRLRAEVAAAYFDGDLNFKVTLSMRFGSWEPSSGIETIVGANGGLSGGF